jgi:monoamine oxidase
MLETAIVGGGLCGLAVAAHLHRRGETFALFEARQRLGGRILTMDCKVSGLAIDLGAAWFWPDNQPLMSALLAEMGLESFAQHDEGAALRLSDADKKPEKIEVAGGVHGGARKVVGGAQKTIDGLREGLPPGAVRLGCVLTALRDCGDHVVLSLLQDGAPMVVEARRVVLALPPRLAEERIAFEPALDEAMIQAMRDAPTWMAAQAKAVATYEKPVWRAAGQSGNAFVNHEQAVFDEIFDSCDAQGSQGALGGFVALNADLRQAFAVGLPLLMRSQMEQVFGADLTEREQFFQDWATEGQTCSALDRERGREEHNLAAHPLLRRALWAGKLHLGGSETAARQAGYMEGALEAARRISRDIMRYAPAGDEEATLAGESVNAASLRRLKIWVEAQGDAAFDDYRRRLNALLAGQEKTQLTQRAMLGAAEAVFAQALRKLESLPFDLTRVAVEQGRCALTPEAQKPFGDFLRQFHEDVVAFNRTSCALSNFPDEHHLAKNYEQAIFRDIAAAWTEFSLAANRLLLAKGEQRNQTGANAAIALS